MPATRLVTTTLLLVVATTALLAQPSTARRPFSIGAPTAVADGVDLYRPDARAVMDPAGPIAVHALRVDPTRVRLAMVLAGDVTPARQTVAAIARDHGAIAAINASFFDARGRQVGLAKVEGEHLKTNARARGAAAWTPGIVPVFDRVQSTIAVRPAGSSARPAPVGFVNPTAIRLGLSLFTASFALRIPGRSGSLEPPAATSAGPAAPASAPAAPQDDPAAFEPGVHAWRWQLEGRPWRVRRADRDGRDHWGTGDGAVLTWRGPFASLPPALHGLTPGSAVDLVETWQTLLGSAASAWRDATFAVAGAGLLLHAGRAVHDWTPEDLRAGFTHERHPRSLIGRDAHGRVWLVTVDGRRPDVSAGMSFAELQRLAAALGLTDALNLDGGGSTTLVVRDAIVNHPSDPQGARPVPDAIVVLPRPAVERDERGPSLP